MVQEYDENKAKKDFGRDRRRFRRTKDAATIFYHIKSPANVFMQYGGAEFNAIATDISQDGIGLLSSHELPLHTVLAIRFVLLDTQSTDYNERMKSIEVEGEVKYIVFAVKEKSFRVGAQFMNLTKEHKDFISLFVKMRESAD